MFNAGTMRSIGSWHSRIGGTLERFEDGRYVRKSRRLSKASTSFSNARWATPETAVWVFDPPNSSYHKKIKRATK